MFLPAMKNKVFKSDAGEEFGTIRELQGELPSDLDLKILKPFAEDDCGNYFVVLNSEICFWDHETREVRMLAKSTDDFIKSLHVRDVISLDNVQIRSAWIDPEFAAQLKK